MLCPTSKRYGCCSSTTKLRSNVGSQPWRVCIPLAHSHGKQHGREQTRALSSPLTITMSPAANSRVFVPSTKKIYAAASITLVVQRPFAFVGDTPFNYSIGCAKHIQGFRFYYASFLGKGFVLLALLFQSCRACVCVPAARNTSKFYGSICRPACLQLKAACKPAV